MSRARALVALLSLCLASEAHAQQRADAVVLVNSTSARYADFQTLIRPYLDHFGVPYSVLDLASANVGPEVASYALIVIGHASLDTTGALLSTAEQANISNAVFEGTGLVNFDHDLTTGGTSPRYPYVQTVFQFGYGQAATGELVEFTANGASHYVASLHPAGHVLAVRQMPAAALVPASGSTVLARFQDSSYPFLVAASYGQGRALQFAGTAWMERSTFGRMRGLDDVVWRGMAWAARKPFVMRGLPNFLTLRVDDVFGSMWWVQVANEFQLKPWLGVFYQTLGDTNSI